MEFWSPRIADSGAVIDAKCKSLISDANERRHDARHFRHRGPPGAPKCQDWMRGGFGRIDVAVKQQ